MEWTILAGVVLASVAVIARPIRALHLLVAGAIVFLQPNLGSDASPLRVMGSIIFSAVMLTSSIVSQPDLKLRSLGWLPLMFAGATTIVVLHGGSAIPALLDVLVVGCAVLAAGNPLGRDLLVKPFVGLCIVIAASYAATVVGWLVYGMGSWQIGNVPSAYGYDVPVYLPFTVTNSSVQVFGTTVPRLTGFSREPGWTALFSTVAYFLYPYAGFLRKAPRLLLPISVLGALSTSGFGIFVITLAAAVLVAYRRRRLARVAQRAFGLALLGVGSWLAVSAPVLGLTSKENVASASERGTATDVGIQSLRSLQVGGGMSDSAIPNVNLVAAIAGLGLLFSVLVTLAVLLPFVGGKFWKSRRWAVAPAFAAILATFLFAQPANSSAFAFVCVAIAVAAAANSPLASDLPETGVTGDKNTKSLPIGDSVEPKALSR